MIELLSWLAEHFLFFIVSLFAFSAMGGYIIRAISANRALVRSHQREMAKIRARTETAKALAAAPDEAQRNELAKQLLEAYGEAGEGLVNDEKGSLIRWEKT